MDRYEENKPREMKWDDTIEQYLLVIRIVSSDNTHPTVFRMKSDSIKSNTTANINRRLMRWVTYGMFILALLLFLFQWSIRALSRYPLEEFDEGMRFISRAFVSSGLVPYRDFGILFPPGIFLPAHGIRFQTMEQQNIVIYSIFLFIAIVGAALIYRLRSSNEHVLGVLSGFLVLLVIPLHSENIADVLLALLIMVIVIALQSGRGKMMSFLLFFLPPLIIFWRWDRIIVFVFLESVLFVLSAMWYRRQNKKEQTNGLFHILVLQVGGLIAGMILMGVYLASQGGIANGIDFFYYIPLPVTMPYWDIPLPPILSNWGAEYAATFLVWGIFFLYTLKTVVTRRISIQPRRTMCAVFLVVAPLCALPYALGRSDGGHIQPILFFTGLSLLLTMAIGKKKSVLFPVLFILIVLPVFWVFPAYVYRPYNLFSTSSLLNMTLKDCREKTENTYYRSMFVGRTLYERYFGNNLLLYFLNPSMHPATKYIFENPGLQSSCVYGERIAVELRQAPRPLLSFITDHNSDGYEENKNREVKSCGKIEAYLAETPYRIVGTCVSYGIPYEIRLYEK